MASFSSESSVSRYDAHVLSLSPSEKQPACLRAQDGNLSAHSCLTTAMAQVDSRAALGILILPVLPYLPGFEHLGISL